MKCCVPPSTVVQPDTCEFNGQAGTCLAPGTCTGTLGGDCPDGITACCVPQKPFKLLFSRDGYDPEVLIQYSCNSNSNGDRRLKLAKRVAADTQGYVRIADDSGSPVMSLSGDSADGSPDFNLLEDGSLQEMNGDFARLTPSGLSNINDKVRLLSDGGSPVTCAKDGKSLTCSNYERSTLYGCDFDDTLRLSFGVQDHCRCTKVALLVEYQE